MRGIISRSYPNLAHPEAGESLTGAPNYRAKPITMSFGVEPNGKVKVSTYVDHSRAQVDLAIMRATFKEAGWDIAVDKVQLGFQIQELGMLLSSDGDGLLTVPEAKRQGMLVEIADHQEPSSNDGSVTSEDVDGLTGRCLHIAQVASEANAYLQPMYAMKKLLKTIGRCIAPHPAHATPESCHTQAVPRPNQTTAEPHLTHSPSRRADGSKIRVRPSRIRVQGGSPAQLAYRDALDWWAQALSDNISTPLAPRLAFPELGEPGVAFMFTDAAREDGTGMGAFTFIETEEGQIIFPYINPRWPGEIIRMLQANVLSMPAGEGLGAVIFADALIEALPSITHLIIFTDSSPVQAAIQSSSSGSPQLNFIVNWLFQRHPSVQFIAIHQPGVRNSAADGLSRAASATVLSEAEAAGAQLFPLPSHQHALDLMHAASTKPQRPRP